MHNSYEFWESTTLCNSLCAGAILGAVYFQILAGWARRPLLSFSKYNTLQLYFVLFFRAVFVLLGGLCSLRMQHIILIYMFAKIINFISGLSCQLCPDNSFTWPWLQCKFPCELNKDINYYFIMLLLINHFLLFVDWTSFKHSWKQRIHSR